MAKLNDIFGGSFLKAEDLKGKTVQVTISEVETKKFDDGNKLVVHFHGKDKALVCNKTNANIVAEVLQADDTDDWVGGVIKLTVKKVEFQGKLMPAIRVVLEERAPAKAEPDATELDDEIPFS